jgi:hypothetical protein
MQGNTPAASMPTAFAFVNEKRVRASQKYLKFQHQPMCVN